MSDNHILADADADIFSYLNDIYFKSGVFNLFGPNGQILIVKRVEGHKHIFNECQCIYTFMIRIYSCIAFYIIIYWSIGFFLTKKY